MDKYRVNILAIKKMRITYNKLAKQYGILINHLYLDYYELYGDEDKVKNFIQKEQRYIMEMEIK